MMVQFGRPAPPVEPPQNPPPLVAPPSPPRRTATIEQQPASLLKGVPDVTIPPAFKRFCLWGFAAQVVLDIVTILVVRFMKGAFFTIPVASVCLVLDFSLFIWAYRASPRPIDVLMKNALSGVAWFMLAVINGAIIGDAKNPYPFAICLTTFIVNATFWCWTVWWGLNDRGPRSMYSAQRSRRCFNCRNGTGMFPGHNHCRRSSAGGGNMSYSEGSIALGAVSKQPISPARIKEALPAEHVGVKAENVVRGHHQVRQQSFSSSNFTEGKLAEGACGDAMAGDSPV